MGGRGIEIRGVSGPVEGPPESRLMQRRGSARESGKPSRRTGCRSVIILAIHHDYILWKVKSRLRANGFHRRGAFQWVGRLRPENIAPQTDRLTSHEGTLQVIGGLGDHHPPPSSP